MKKNMIALAVASAFAAPVAMADAPTIFGKLNVNASFTDSAGAKDLKINDTASRIGLKGSEDLGNGLKAVYHVEFDVDLANTGTLSGRNQIAGLAGGFGTVVMGRHDTPEKMSQASDLFNDGAADLAKPNMVGDVNVNEVRSGNVLAYISPSFSGVKFMAAVVANGTDSAGATSAFITYGSKKKGLYLAGGMTDFKTNTTTTANTAGPADTTRLSAQYKANGLTANVIYMDSTKSVVNGTADDTNGTVTQINLGYKIGKFMPKIKMSSVDPKATGVASHTNMAYGLNYSLGKKTTAYVYTVDADKKNSDGKDATILGMVHKF